MIKHNRTRFLFQEISRKEERNILRDVRRYHGFWPAEELREEVIHPGAGWPYEGKYKPQGGETYQGRDEESEDEQGDNRNSWN